MVFVQPPPSSLAHHPVSMGARKVLNTQQPLQARRRGMKKTLPFVRYSILCQTHSFASASCFYHQMNLETLAWQKQQLQTVAADRRLGAINWHSFPLCTNWRVHEFNRRSHNAPDCSRDAEVPCLIAALPVAAGKERKNCDGKRRSRERERETGRDGEKVKVKERIGDVERRCGGDPPLEECKQTRRAVRMKLLQLQGGTFAPKLNPTLHRRRDRKRHLNPWTSSYRVSFVCISSVVIACPLLPIKLELSSDDWFISRGANGRMVPNWRVTVRMDTVNAVCFKF